MNVQLFVLGPLENNAFVVWSTAPACVVIDAPSQPEPLMEFVCAQALQPKAVLLTHGHFDHIGGLGTMVNAWKAPVYVHEKDGPLVSDPLLNGSSFFGLPAIAEKVDHLVKDGEILSFAQLLIQVIHTPGHTPGGCCFLVEKHLFSGDTLFCQSVGRTDLPLGSTKELLKSIRDKLFMLPDNTVVLSGHGPETTIGAEKAGNPFILGF